MQLKLMRSLTFRIVAVHKMSGNKGSKTPGVDGICFQGAPESKKKVYWETVETLRAIIGQPKKYRAMPVRRVWIPQSNGKKRPRGIPTIIDRALQQLVSLVLEPLVESTSDSNSYGFRKNRNAKMALGVLREMFKTFDKEYATLTSPLQIPARVGVHFPEDK